MAFFSRNINLQLLRGSRVLRLHVQPVPYNGLHTCVHRHHLTVLRLAFRGQQHTCLVTPQPWCLSVAALRLNSTDSGGGTGTTIPDGYIPEAPAPPPDGYIPEPPPLPADELAQLQGTVEPILNALGEPTLASLGLCNWTPPGLVQWAVENMHVGLDLPWWGAIVAGTLCLRLLVFPLVILGQRNTANMGNHMPTVQRLQEKMTRARSSGNPMEAARIAVELQDYMRRNKVNPLKGMIVPLAQVPIFISVFIGLRKMANLPVQSMESGGMLWFYNLTIPDPFYALPIMTAATFLMTVEVGADGMGTNAMSRNMKMVMRIMPFVMLPMIINFPTGLCMYWLTSNTFSLCQVVLLKIPAVREYFNIPTPIKHDHAYDLKKQMKKGFIQGMKESWSNQKMLSQMESRQRAETDNFKQSGKSPLIKTYKENPMAKKAKSKS